MSNLKKKRVKSREQDPIERGKNFKEVSLGYGEEEAIEEANRCLGCKNPKCVEGCPVSVNIPSFISFIKKGDFSASFEELSKYNALPAVCGRVCPQESQCEGKCVLGIKGEPLAIGQLERFIADFARNNKLSSLKKSEKILEKVAVIGSGPAGLTCAGELAKLGYRVTIFEALHESGGVLVYGIPEFRLPKKDVVKYEIEEIKKLGVKIENNVVVGKTVDIDELIENEGFKAVFIGSGAGLPKFMGIKGENANGVFSANEVLTRVNLMKAFKNESHTPLNLGKKVAVVGGGNVAMDAARTSLRLGAETHIIYRRSEKELPARLEEIHHAKEEGVILDVLTNPTEILTDEKGWVKGIKCIRMKLGEEDSSGRRRPIEIENSEFIMEVDSVIMSLGTSPNPLISNATKGLKTNKRGCLLVDEESLKTSLKGIYAGGDAVTGAATVILAMGAGKKAAKSIDSYLRKEEQNNIYQFLRKSFI
ncbi:TPA: NADPH-dependent glutamate synthase [Clostridium perfringens]|nr:oxidoreductase [Clostridium perfringens]HCG3022561.1 NADPH-dependent glutamate synthase [Clostridium perfringens]